MHDGVPAKRGRKRKLTAFEVDEIETQKQICEFYQRRLDEAEEKLGELLAATRG